MSLFRLKGWHAGLCHKADHTHTAGLQRHVKTVCKYRRKLVGTVPLGGGRVLKAVEEMQLWFNEGCFWAVAGVW